MKPGVKPGSKHPHKGRDGDSKRVMAAYTDNPAYFADRTVAELAAEFGVSPGVIRWTKRRYGVQYRAEPPGRKKGAPATKSGARRVSHGKYA